MRYQKGEGGGAMSTDIMSYGMANLVHIALLMAYGLIVMLCLLETMLEIIRSGAPWDRWKVLGVALSIVWPVLILVFILSHFFGRRSGRRA